MHSTSVGANIHHGSYLLFIFLKWIFCNIMLRLYISLPFISIYKLFSPLKLLNHSESHLCSPKDIFYSQLYIIYIVIYNNTYYFHTLYYNRVICGCGTLTPPPFNFVIFFSVFYSWGLLLSFKAFFLIEKSFLYSIFWSHFAPSPASPRLSPSPNLPNRFLLSI